VVVLDGPGDVPEESTIAGVLKAAAVVGAPAAPLHDVTSVVRHPQVVARDMIVGQSHDGVDVLITGNHLVSLRRGAPPPAPAPVDQDDATWRTDTSWTEGAP
jgi:crotonobetainyl-CoA:carnitine CoA-transferase CaiB-like acyl-CoA transferase